MQHRSETHRSSCVHEHRASHTSICSAPRLPLFLLSCPASSCVCLLVGRAPVCAACRSCWLSVGCRAGQRGSSNDDKLFRLFAKPPMQSSRTFVSPFTASQSAAYLAPLMFPFIKTSPMSRNAGYRANEHRGCSSPGLKSLAITRSSVTSTLPEQAQPRV